MVITIGFSNPYFTIELYVNGQDKVHCMMYNPLEIIYLIRMMKDMFPISIAWGRIPLDIRQQVIKLIQDNITV